MTTRRPLTDLWKPGTPTPDPKSNSNGLTPRTKRINRTVRITQQGRDYLRDLEAKAQS